MTHEEASTLNLRRLENPNQAIKIRFRGRVYDYRGWYGSQTDVTLYEEGCCNMQDAVCVPLSECEIV